MPDPIRKDDRVALVRDVPDAGLHAGDVGAVTHLFPANVLEVAFDRPAGAPRAMLVLPGDAVRRTWDNDLAPWPAA
jgi:hypothetical protein